MIKILFFGSGDYPVPILKKLLNASGIKVTGLVTSPFADKSSCELLDLGIPTFQPRDANKDAKKILEASKPDLILACNYGQILKSYILNFPKYKCLNIHYSLLPILRGACPIEAAIIQGLKTSGVTIQIMREELDTGEIIFQKKVAISDKETGGSLAEKMQEVAKDNIVQAVKDWINQKIKPQAQDHSKATYCHRDDISKEKAKINWSEPAEILERKIRAFNPRPVAWTQLKKDSKRLKIFKADFEEKNLGLKAGETSIDGEKLLVQTAKGVIIPREVQLEGKSRMSIEQFLKGYRGEVRFS